MLQRERYERENCGGYELIYPLVSYQEEFDNNSQTQEDPRWAKQARYVEYMEMAKQLWNSFTNGKPSHKKRKYAEE